MPRVWKGRHLPDGTLAGSTITLFDAVKNAVDFHIPLETALYAATVLPAKAVGLEEEVGSIACGMDADLLIVDGPSESPVGLMESETRRICPGIAENIRPITAG